MVQPQQKLHQSLHNFLYVSPKVPKYRRRLYSAPGDQHHSQSERSYLRHRDQSPGHLFIRDSPNEVV